MSYHLTDVQIASFEDNGFLAIEKLLDEDDLTPLEREYEELLDRVAGQLRDAGKTTSTYSGLPFGERFEALLGEFRDLHRYLNISLPLTNEPVAALDFVTHAGPAVFSVLRNEKILDVVESIIGPEIYSNPVQQMRMKPPVPNLDRLNSEHSNVGTTPWHQDIVALMPEADDTDLLTVWVAVTEASVHNGCLVSAPKSHLAGDVVHCPGKILTAEPTVPQQIVREHQAVPLPVERGGIILFNKRNLHGSLPNRSDKLRWSMDLRYNRTGQPTGRPAFPGFIARSRANPHSELRDAGEWKRLWDNARARILDGDHTEPLYNVERCEQSSNSLVCA